MILYQISCSKITDQQTISNITKELEQFGFSLFDENLFFIKSINYKADNECLMIYSDGLGNFEFKIFHSQDPEHKFKNKKLVHKISNYRFDSNKILKYKKAYLLIDDIPSILKNNEMNKIKLDQYSKYKFYSKQLYFLGTLQTNIFDKWSRLNQEKSNFFVPQYAEDEVTQLIQKNNFTYIYMQNNDQNLIKYMKFKDLNQTLAKQEQQQNVDYFQLNEDQPQICKLTYFICRNTQCTPITNRYILDNHNGEIYTIHFGNKKTKYVCFITKKVNDQKIENITANMWELCKPNKQEIIGEIIDVHNDSQERLKRNSNQMTQIKKKISNLKEEDRTLNNTKEINIGQIFQSLDNINLKMDMVSFYIHCIGNKQTLVFKNFKIKNQQIKDKYDRFISLHNLKIGKDSKIYLYKKCFSNNVLTRDWIMKNINTTQRKVYNHLVNVRKNIKYRLFVPTGGSIAKGFDICSFPEMINEDSKFFQKTKKHPLFLDTENKQDNPNVQEILNFNNIQMKEDKNIYEQFLFNKFQKIQQYELFFPYEIVSKNQSFLIKDTKDQSIYKAFYFPEEWIEIDKEKPLFGGVKLYIINNDCQDSALIIKNTFLHSKYDDKFKKTQQCIQNYKAIIDIKNDNEQKLIEFDNSINNSLTFESISLNQSSNDTFENIKMQSSETFRNLQSRKNSNFSDDLQKLNIKCDNLLLEADNMGTYEFIQYNQDQIINIQQEVPVAKNSTNNKSYLSLIKKSSGYIFGTVFAILLFGAALTFKSTNHIEENNYKKSNRLGN